jgi:hypothetical protein
VADDEASRLEAVPQQQKSPLTAGMIRVVDRPRMVIEKYRLSFLERDLVLANIG